jgi:hypothetical protein
VLAGGDRRYGQPGQPSGQVPFTGVTHCGFFVGMLEATLQQICSAVQQKVPQQCAPATLHSTPSWSMHIGGGEHTPLSQNGVVPEQTVPHPPQLCGSL